MSATLRSAGRAGFSRLYLGEHAPGGISKEPGPLTGPLHGLVQNQGH